MLVAFRTTGILKEPPKLEIINLEAVKWEFQRPNQYVIITDKLESTYVSDCLSVSMYVLMVSYHNNSKYHNDNDYLRIIVMINSTSTNPNCFVESVYVTFRKDSQPSLVDWLGSSLNFKNLSLFDYSSGWTIGENHRGAYVRTTNVNHSSQIYFQATAEWSLLTLGNQTHQTEVVHELTYFDGTVFKRIIQPFQLKVVGR